MDGLLEGCLLGDELGELEGWALGELEGSSLGDALGELEGRALGEPEGCLLGRALGEEDGMSDTEGLLDGAFDTEGFELAVGATDLTGLMVGGFEGMAAKMVTDEAPAGIEFGLSVW